MEVKQEYVIGVDFGTDSVRSILVNSHSGEEIASSDFQYPRWKKGLYCNVLSNQFRQHPLDYIEGLQYIFNEMLQSIDLEVKENIRAISIGTTGSTPIAVDEKGIPLAMHPDYSENPNAMFFLWKDHTAVKEAEEINQYAKKFDTNYLKYVGGIYSSEWYWAKLLYALRNDSDVKNSCYTWVEHSDWIPYLLTGVKDVSQMKRNVCAAGHKAIWAKEFDGFPPEEFFLGLDPLLKGFSKKLSKKTYSSAEPAGNLSQEWSDLLGLSTDVVVGVGALDAHMGAVGGQIEVNFLSKVMGTSTCDMIVAFPVEMQGKLIEGICGQVKDSIIPGMIGMEAGQSAFGDIYAWFGDLISWPLTKMLGRSNIIDKETANKLADEIKDKILIELTKAASDLPIEENSELAVDWLNGRRTPDANQNLKGAIHGLNLGSDAPLIYRSFVESTCFGSKKIVEHFQSEGINIKGVIGVGGVAKKAPFIMQMMADVLGMPIKIHKSEQTCALGASMFAATVAGVYSRVEEAMVTMGPGFEKVFFPDKERNRIYNIRYRKYKAFCNFLDSKTGITYGN